MWETGESDVSGCVQLRNKLRLADRPFDLMSKQVPVLALADALAERGFVGIGEVVHHTPEVRDYDSRKLHGRRSYLQCVLHFQALMAKGVQAFHSTGSNHFFEALLRGKTAVRPGLPAKAYKRMLALEDGDALDLDDDMAALAAPVAKAARTSRRPKANAARAAIADQGPEEEGAPSSHDSIVGGGSDAPPSDAHVAKRDGGVGGDIGAVPLQDEGDAGSAGPADSVATSGYKGALPDGVPRQILGSVVRFVPGRATATHTYADRLSVKCTNPLHINCSKSRSLAMMKDRLGVRCAEAFLGAWLKKADDLSWHNHAKFNPKLVDMEAYLAAHP